MTDKALVHKYTKKLSDVSYINPTKKEIENVSDETEVSFLPMSGVSEDGVALALQTKKLKEVKKGFTYFRNGDVLFAKITPCMENGKRWLANSLINGIGFGSTEFHVLRPKSDVTSEWLYYFVSRQSFRDNAGKNMTGTAGQKRVPKQFLENIPLFVPPIELQLSILKTLQHANCVYQKRKQANLIADKLLHAVFMQMFGDPIDGSAWKQEKLKDISFSVESGSTPLRTISENFETNGIPLLKVENINSFGYITLKPNQLCLSKEANMRQRRSSLKENDVLINIVGPPLGKVAFVKKQYSGANINQAIVLIRPNPSRLNSFYLWSLLRFPSFNQMIINMSVSVRQANINLSEMRNLKVPVPPIQLQEKFATIADDVERIREKQHSSELEIYGLCSSLMDKAFNGELVN